MMKGQLTKFVICLAYFCLVISAQNPCRYETPHGVIDLTSIGRQDNVPAFQNIPSVQPSDYKYSYNPCKSFTQGADCTNVAGCQIANNEGVRFPLGSQESAQWVDLLGGHVMLQYKSGDKILQVALECDEGQPAEFEVIGEDPMNNYKFRLKHKCACWNGCGGGPGPTPGTTTRGGGGGGGGGDGGSGSSVGGAVFLGLFFGLLVVYFVGFALYNRVQLNKSGLEVIPHRGFWSGFGGYVAEGFRFTFHKITGKGQYQSV